MFSADGRRLMATTPEGMMKLWDLRRLIEELQIRNLSW